MVSNREKTLEIIEVENGFVVQGRPLTGYKNREWVFNSAEDLAKWLESWGRAAECDRDKAARTKCEGCQ